MKSFSEPPEGASIPSELEEISQSAIGQTLTELFEIHRAMIGKLILHDPQLANYVAIFLEDVANRYLDISEALQSRKPIIPEG